MDWERGKETDAGEAERERITIFVYTAGWLLFALGVCIIHCGGSEFCCVF